MPTKTSWCGRTCPTRGSSTTSTTARSQTPWRPPPANNPSNPFGGYLHLVTDSKYDDGAPLTGTFRSAGRLAGTAYDGVENCLPAGTPVQWHGASAQKNCGGVTIQ
jgi:hypothetical protein